MYRTPALPPPENRYGLASLGSRKKTGTEISSTDESNTASTQTRAERVSRSSSTARGSSSIAATWNWVNRSSSAAQSTSIAAR